MIDLKKWIDEVSNRLKVIYVVEKFSGSAWTYTKYSDGTVVATRKESITLKNYVTVSNTFGGYQITLNLPSDVFISADYLLCDCRIGNGFAIFGGHLGSLSTKNVTLFALSTATGSVATVWDVEIHGRWK